MIRQISSPSRFPVYIVYNRRVKEKEEALHEDHDSGKQVQVTTRAHFREIHYAVYQVSIVNYRIDIIC